MEEAKATPKLSQFEIKPAQEPPSLSFNLVEFDEPEQEKTPFFKPRARRRRSDTWIISVFVIIHIGTFFATMFVNDCWRTSHRDCSLKTLGRLSFQPLSENPLLGPSASTLDEMGALGQTLLRDNHQIWRLFTCPWLHAGVIHLVINLGCIIFVGIYLEQEFGPLRTGTIYILSAFVGSLVAALFIRNIPAVGSSGALFGLLGAMLSGLIRNWNLYNDKFAALALLFFVSMINFAIGLLPYVDNFSSIGGFISGFLLGFILLFTPQISQVPHNKAGLYGYKVKTSDKLKQKLDRPILRSVSLLLFGLVLVGCLVPVLRGININQYCKWCRYADCVPFERWSCNDIVANCETMVSDSQLTLTCVGNGNFRVFPYTNISHGRIKDLCTLLCS
ncbi:hypothetical protein Ddye_006111 [Dipteronia dyeriana]|uniref:RHOMBOID-like protein n=1 Tax=Dipteronia dyeriana TaxID=168575 RepID=A0AAE0CQV8_9ROSI|nr:hypothetical protein Ddye_006111 [Dipteronia dyeriana]